MPLVNIDVVGLETRLDAARTQQLADDLALIFGSEPRGTWVTVRAVPAEQYAENDGAAPELAPAFVRIIQRDPPQGETLTHQTSALTEAVASLLSRSARNTHIIYEPSARGRVVFGGRLVE
jgi:phenylpyruvate tautomerase PptA (4-oxalocrotonate tautomerase family)